MFLNIVVNYLFICRILFLFLLCMCIYFFFIQLKINDICKNLIINFKKKEEEEEEN